MLILPPTGLRLGVVADTHSAPHAESLKNLAALKPQAILHGGDIGDLSVLSALENIAPVHAVRGNIDEKTPGLLDVQHLEVSEQGRTVFKIYLTHIAVAGPKLRKEVALKARAWGASLVVCGHSHVPFLGQDKGLTMFNPGSIGPRRFSLPICFGVIDISTSGVTLRHVNGETGDTWLPNL
jgi:uncharacterized protein